MYEKFKRKIQPTINIYHLFKAAGANLFYRFPARKIKTIGITGTDGKTTTTFLIYQILRELTGKVSIVSSVYAKIGTKEYATGLHVTTPDAIMVQKLLRLARKAKDEYFVLETTSHALDQNRVWGNKFEVGMITNITNEHLDYHKTYERYVWAKLKLLLMSKRPLVNADDKSLPLLKNILQAKKRKFYTYGLRNKADFNLNIDKELRLKLSNFNNYNYLAAFATCRLLGFSEEKILKALEKAKLPQGRAEVVYDQDFKAIIDFAHTPNSIYKILEYVRNKVAGKEGKIIHVFGSAGLRDAQKRPFMGQASGKFSNVVILTEEDYRTEDPLKISEEIAAGLRVKHFSYMEPKALDSDDDKVFAIILNREQAIKKAVEIAQKGDVILLTGKSHEQSLARGKVEYPWDEKKALFKALKKKILTLSYSIV